MSWLQLCSLLFLNCSKGIKHSNDYKISSTLLHTSRLIVQNISSGALVRQCYRSPGSHKDEAVSSTQITWESVEEKVPLCLWIQQSYSVVSRDAWIWEWMWQSLVLMEQRLYLCHTGRTRKQNVVNSLTMFLNSSRRYFKGAAFFTLIPNVRRCVRDGFTPCTVLGFHDNCDPCMIIGLPL